MPVGFGAQRRHFEVDPPLDSKIREDQELQNGFPLSLCFMMSKDALFHVQADHERKLPNAPSSQN